MGANIGMIPGMKEHGVPLKLLGDAIFLRNDIHGKLEEAETENDPELRRLSVDSSLSNPNPGASSVADSAVRSRRSARQLRGAIQQTPDRGSLTEAGGVCISATVPPTETSPMWMPIRKSMRHHPCK